MEPTLENPAAVELKIKHLINTWGRLSKLNHTWICILGTIAVVGGFFVSSFLATTDLVSIWVLKVISCLSSVSIGLLTAFDMINNRNKYRNAWRMLNTKFMLYESQNISLEQLINYYEQAEQMIGNINYSFKAPAGKGASDQ